jgi:hypothetical protein
LKELLNKLIGKQMDTMVDILNEVKE